MTFVNNAGTTNGNLENYNRSTRRPIISSILTFSFILLEEPTCAISKPRHGCHPCLGIIGGVADLERIVREIWHSTYRKTCKVTKPQKANQKGKNWKRRHVEQTVRSHCVNVAPSLGRTDREKWVAGSLQWRQDTGYSCRHALPQWGHTYRSRRILTDDCRPYSDSRSTAMMQIMIDEMESEERALVNFKIRLRQAIDDIVWWPRYLVKVTE